MALFPKNQRLYRLTISRNNFERRRDYEHRTCDTANLSCPNLAYPRDCRKACAARDRRAGSGGLGQRDLIAAVSLGVI